MSAVPSLSESQIEEISNVLGDTELGLTGAEIGKYLARLKIHDPEPTITKRRRLYAALSGRQRVDRCANQVLAFVKEVMNPVNYTGRRSVFEERRERLNTVLAFCGLNLGDDGLLRRRNAARTLSEAEERARRLRISLVARGVHADVLQFCQAELLDDNFFHAVFEATKSVADKIRARTGLVSDGAPLVDQAFCGATPVLAINSLRTETEKSEQSGFANLMKGMFGTFRNTTAHAPKIRWPIDEQDALDLLSLASYVHRRIDGAALTRTN